MSVIIRVNNLRKVYLVGTQKVAALNNVNLEIEKGEFCCIVGASGSGKSTLLNQLAGLEKPTSGSVFIGKYNISEMTESKLAKFRQNHLGFVFQSYNLLPTMTAMENVALPLMFKGVPKQKREILAARQLAKLGLGKRINHKPTEMSGGQQQRVGIARAFVTKPKVIFADEPTGNLDSTTTEKVMNVMLKLARENNITIIMVTHERDLAGCADRIITLKDGKVISNEKTENPNKEFVITTKEISPETSNEDAEDVYYTAEEAAKIFASKAVDDNKADESIENELEEQEEELKYNDNDITKQEDIQEPEQSSKIDEVIETQENQEVHINEDVLKLKPEATELKDVEETAELLINSNRTSPLSADEFLP